MIISFSHVGKNCTFPFKVEFQFEFLITASGRDRLIFLKEGDNEFEKAQKIVRGNRKLLLKIIPEKIELLDYDFAKKGYSRLQILDL